jgi:hypothetical protein
LINEGSSLRRHLKSRQQLGRKYTY